MSAWGNYPLSDEYRAKVLAARMGLPEGSNLTVKTTQTEERFSVDFSMALNFQKADPIKQLKRKPTKLL